MIMEPLPEPFLFSHLFLDGGHQPPFTDSQRHELQQAPDKVNATGTPSSASSEGPTTAQEGDESPLRRAGGSEASDTSVEEEEKEDSDTESSDEEEEQYDIPIERRQPKSHADYEDKRYYFWEKLTNPKKTFSSEYVEDKPFDWKDRGSYESSFALHGFLYTCFENIRYMQRNKKAGKALCATEPTQRGNNYDKLPAQDARVIECLLDDIMDAKVTELAEDPLEAVEASIKREIFYYITGIEIARIPVHIPLEELDSEAEEQTRKELSETNIIEPGSDIYVDCWLYKSFAEAYLSSKLWRKGAFAGIAEHIQKVFNLSDEVVGAYTSYGIRQYLGGIKIDVRSIEPSGISRFNTPPNPGDRYDPVLGKGLLKSCQNSRLCRTVDKAFEEQQKKRRK
eukprot:gb/GECG01004065.1/.p1 GENE.gb/GECG01004065.1/~~gb/GECG01004065.1/.p1  ORF type:complete len:396 (+),score=73.26 gb/GECG01004065.1/:1-1188(+)